MPNRYAYIGLLCSIFIHIGLIELFVPGTHDKELVPLAIDVTVEPEQKPINTEEHQQIVTPPENTEETPPPEKTKFLSEKDFSTAKEQVHRGDPLAGDTRPKTKQVPPSKQAPPPQQQTQPLKNLKLDSGTLLNKFGNEDARANELATKSLKEALSLNAPTASNYKPFSRASGSGAAFLGNRGTTDFLPSLPDGDLTMLNAKADRFAGFVRRVATQVFAQLRAQGWESLSASDVQNINDYSDVRAVLSKRGELLKVYLNSSSGSSKFDDVVVKAVKQVARDPNPPAEAAADDGNIHFIFQSKSWVGGSINPRTQAPFERRWILLGTGLE